MTLNELVRERRKYLVELQRRWRTLDTRIERGQRLIKRILARRTKVPEIKDLNQIEIELTGVMDSVTKVNNLIEKGFVV